MHPVARTINTPQKEMGRALDQTSNLMLSSPVHNQLGHTGSDLTLSSIYAHFNTLKKKH